MTELRPFHCAFPGDDLQQARALYVGVLGCGEGRSSDQWIDFELFGHQVVAHLVDRSALPACNTNPVDGDHVPVPHFGVVLGWTQLHDFAARLQQQGVDFVIEPRVCFQPFHWAQITQFPWWTSSSSCACASRAWSANKRPCSSAIRPAMPSSSRRCATPSNCSPGRIRRRQARPEPRQADRSGR